MKDNQCMFCNLSQDKEIIAENDLAIAFYDGFPVNPGHSLIIPKRHVANYFDLTAEECAAMQDLLKTVKKKVEDRFHPDGYNIGVNVNAAGGQSVFHVHMHLIPRYLGDVDNPKGGVRGVIPSKQKY
ncbi:MAG TPA: HIT family protein [Candidatus Aphodousia faecavium]|nr:HIT family protein [Candidatus Aphodousia faecavium]